MNETVPPSDLPAPFWRRLLALAYELLAVLAILFVTDMACLLLTRGQLDPHAWWYRAVLLLALAAYFLLSWTRGGQSLGMRPWRLYLRTDAGAIPTWPHAALRFAILIAPLTLLAIAPWAGAKAAMAVPFAVWALSLLTALIDRRRRALHDILAGTWIVYRPIPKA
ncbi:RDD family protein [Oleiagrimonas soli]|uniref:Putative RDD family membrane protein YckC n=1 Tax=Oleiagrimonas soli TaxID=1543381 RepID=A0A099CY76_9GAMM|nr:RDD family protein [Oleiagrimonas soli]KGI78729.1 hypothetical protein LF63_0103585 [Oleiagrimonas soli]MBB6184169.1 putative RDD family membrane protein YckC [Oleiagrimonas soli]